MVLAGFFVAGTFPAKSLWQICRIKQAIPRTTVICRVSGNFTVEILTSDLWESLGAGHGCGNSTFRA